MMPLVMESLIEVSSGWWLLTRFSLRIWTLVCFWNFMWAPLSMAPLLALVVGRFEATFDDIRCYSL